ncbi:MAG: ribonuclease P protein component [Legionellales bacterium]|nr:ribonuclease P protein component [Legionellales bacterium]
MNNTPARETRIRSQDEFSAVFSLGNRFKSRHSIFIYKKNNQACSRLGVVVSKKCFKSAVARNYIKRLHKEVFRSSEISQKYDIVVVSKRSIAGLPKEQLYTNMKSQWNTFLKCLSNS